MVENSKSGHHLLSDDRNSKSSGWKASYYDCSWTCSHAPDPLEETFNYQGDPGLFGPQSVTWKVMGDVSSFIGGIRALLIRCSP